MGTERRSQTLSHHQKAVGALAGPAPAHLSCERASIAIDLTGETKWSGGSAFLSPGPAQLGLLFVAPRDVVLGSGGGGGGHTSLSGARIRRTWAFVQSSGVHMPTFFKAYLAAKHKRNTHNGPRLLTQGHHDLCVLGHTIQFPKPKFPCPIQDLMLS